ncbi:MAG: permease prefix domain 1-containing protein [Defluviitaleaceae bacterium]|nr:permease prefix domain 1-containing protein [Defluviitaleaceae bacterium]
MKENVYVERLFADYENTPEIIDFKEEISANLAANIRGLISKGLSEEQAFDKATAELGDITDIADSVGKKKRNEAIWVVVKRNFF